MTNEEIGALRHEQPREFDAAVAEWVMGWEWLERKHESGESFKALFPPMRDGWDRIGWPNDEAEAKRIWTPAKQETKRYWRWDRAGTHRIFSAGLPNYSTDPAADYAALSDVRDKWTKQQKFAFCGALHSIWFARSDPLWLAYRVGDYAEAALRVWRLGLLCREEIRGTK